MLSEIVLQKVEFQNRRRELLRSSHSGKTKEEQNDHLKVKNTRMWHGPIFKRMPSQVIDASDWL
jgi:hypothetical protein